MLKDTLDLAVREVLGESIPIVGVSMMESSLLREAREKTGDRIARAWEEYLQGYSVGAIDMALTSSFGMHCMVVEKGIDFSSLCMHHFMPFYGTVDIIYLPKDHICGLSKLSRVVDKYAKRFQLQELLGSCIANELWAALKPEWVIVRINSKHTCVGCRGVNKSGATLTTITALGLGPDYTSSAEKAAEVCRNVL